MTTQDIVKSVTDEAFSPLFDREEFRDLCLKALRNAGCRPPVDRLLYFLMEKMTLAGRDYIGDQAKKKIYWFLENTRGFRALFEKFSAIAAKAKDSERLRQDLLAYLRNQSSLDSVPVDQTTDREILEFLYLKTELKGIESNVVTQLNELRGAIDDYFRDIYEPSLEWPEGAQSKDLGAIDNLYFASERDAFVGREREIDLLWRFLGDPSMALPSNRFRWLLLTGPGGEGKSRLAFEFSKRATALGWKTGRLSDAELSRIDLTRWRPRCATLMVIDYASIRPEVVSSILGDGARQRRKFDFPVRVLLLEREANEHWLRRLLPAGNDTLAIRNTAFLPWPHYQNIDPIPPDQIVQLMENRFKTAGLEPPPKETLLQAAMAVDWRARRSGDDSVPIPRPLFASAAAEALITEIKNGRESVQRVVDSLDSDGVLIGLLNRDRDQRWSNRFRDRAVENEARERHENLLMLATISGGVEERQLADRQWLRATDALPGGDNFPLDRERLGRMGGFANGRISQLEPDILGEIFVLDRLAHLNKEIAAQVLTIGLNLGGPVASEFLVRCARDFPTRWKSLGELRPLEHDDAAQNAFAHAQASIITLTKGVLDRFYEFGKLLDSTEQLALPNTAGPSDDDVLYLRVFPSEKTRLRPTTPHLTLTLMVSDRSNQLAAYTTLACRTITAEGLAGARSYTVAELGAILIKHKYRGRRLSRTLVDLAMGLVSEMPEFRFIVAFVRGESLGTIRNFQRLGFTDLKLGGGDRHMMFVDMCKTTGGL
jgi:hypothetical protein